MRYIIAMIVLCMTLSIEAAAVEKNIAIPVPKINTNTYATAIYCDAILAANLRDNITGKNTLEAGINDRISDRFVIVISDSTLYVHNQSDFDKGDLFWGESKPLKILKNDPKQEIIAIGYNEAPVSSNVLLFSLNRSTGVGLFVEMATPVAQKSEIKLPSSYSMYLSCGVRKK